MLSSDNVYMNKVLEKEYRNKVSYEEYRQGSISYSMRLLQPTSNIYGIFGQMFTQFTS